MLTLKTVVISSVIGAAMWVGAYKATMAIHTAYVDRHKVTCCDKPAMLDQVSNAQALHAFTDTAAMCRQRGGNAIWVGNVYDSCLVGNGVGVTTYP